MIPRTYIPGDINQDTRIDLADVILTLKVASEVDLNIIMREGNDVNGDGKIGIEEAVYVLQQVAE